jgi:hypothetical protein
MLFKVKINRSQAGTLKFRRSLARSAKDHCWIVAKQARALHDGGQQRH